MEGWKFDKPSVIHQTKTIQFKHCIQLITFWLICSFTKPCPPKFSSIHFHQTSYIATKLSYCTVFNQEGYFSRLQEFLAWQPDPSIKYLEGMNIVLFLVALVFTVFFILPLAFVLIFSKIVTQSKKVMHLFFLFLIAYI